MQESLFSGLCSCLERQVEAAGLCRHCYGRRYRSRRLFGGHRESALRRDRRCCRGCGSFEQIVVHHRQPGVQDVRQLISLCTRCHARVHRSFVLRCWVPEAVTELWREMHPGSPRQLQFSLVDGVVSRAA